MQPNNNEKKIYISAAKIGLKYRPKISAIGRPNFEISASVSAREKPISVYLYSIMDISETPLQVPLDSFVVLNGS